MGEGSNIVSMTMQVSSGLVASCGLRYGIAKAVVEVCSFSSDMTPSVGTSICRGRGHKKKEREKKPTPVSSTQPAEWPPGIHALV